MLNKTKKGNRKMLARIKEDRIHKREGASETYKGETRPSSQYWPKARKRASATAWVEKISMSIRDSKPVPKVRNDKSERKTEVEDNEQKRKNTP